MVVLDGSLRLTLRGFRSPLNASGAVRELTRDVQGFEVLIFVDEWESHAIYDVFRAR
jgi:hypothetical protein